MPNAGKRIDPRERHLLVQFGILLIIILSIKNGTFFLYPYLLKDAPGDIVTLLTVTNIITIVSLGLLLAWLKIGFWIFLGVQIANVPLCLLAGIGKIHSLFGVFSAVILWLFMQIPKGSTYSTWDYLSGNYTTISDTETTKKNKKCRMCNAIYSGSLSQCSSCGSYLYEETTESLYPDKRCLMCKTVFKGTEYICPECGSSLYEPVSKEQSTEEMSNEQGAMRNEQ